MTIRHHRTTGRGRPLLFPTDPDGRTTHPPTVTQLRDAAWEHLTATGTLTAHQLAAHIPLTRGGAWLLLTGWETTGTVRRGTPPAGHAPYDIPFTHTPPTSTQATNQPPADTGAAA